ncbi:MAG: hypothetical protein A2Y24_06130 [Clostridiales bacterium GWE2_32_10]|nr:MAG: hypothetical protein A2Y24_06130 [Clostridiales bacterium GWE2_32_10]HBY21538.1 hypothetical protein [Clostridiales bacterium]
MIRLVSQFDNEKVRTSVATPTCGGCCSCCCCCIVSTVAFTAITTRNFVKATEYISEINEDEVKKEKVKFGILGFFFIPVVIVIMIQVIMLRMLPLGVDNELFLPLIFLPGTIIYLMYLNNLVNRYKSIKKRMTQLVIITPILYLIFIIIEAFAWAALTFH